MTIVSFDQLPLSLTVAEAAAALRIGRCATYELVRSGKLRCIRIGRNIRVPRDAIREFLCGASPA